MADKLRRIVHRSFLLCLALVPAAGAQEPLSLRAEADRLTERIEGLSRFGRNSDGGVSRVAYSEADIQGREYVIGLMREAGLAVRIDTAGNIFGRAEGRHQSRPPILFGSHIDSVPHGGNYDGDLGVLAAIECVQVFYENGVKTKHPLEVVVFTNEEGGLLGSRAMIGGLTEEALEAVSHSGMTVRDGIRAIGGDPDRLDEAVRKSGDVKAFIELHIEQGATLEDAGTDIGVVEGIVGISWWDVTIEGFANHAGTTPMNKRQDALLAAARYVIAVNDVATGIPGRQVATVGKIHALPGAHNVIPGTVSTSLEIRDLSAEKIAYIYQRIRREADAIARETGTVFEFTPLDVTVDPAPTDARMRTIISTAAQKLGLSYRLMPSGAGHDAQDMVRIAPTGMIFVPSEGGISHSPQELTSSRDMANGANVLMRSILLIDAGALD